MTFGHVYLFLGFSFLFSLTCKTSALIMINKFKRNPLDSPKGYTVPARWVKKLFDIKPRMIPNYFYFELILSLVFAFLGPINLIICAIVNGSPTVVGVLIWIQVGLFSLDQIFFIMRAFVFKFFKK